VAEYFFIDTHDTILIFGVATSHQIWCSTDIQSRRFENLLNAVVSKQFLCQCNLLAQEYFLKGFLCTDKQLTNITVVNPSNALTINVINDIHQAISDLECTHANVTCHCHRIAATHFNWIVELDARVTTRLNNKFTTSFFANRNCWIPTMLKKYHLTFVLKTLININI